MTEIDKIIEEIIFLNNDVKNVYEFVENDIKTYRGILDKSIYDLLDIHNKLKEIMIEIKNLGTKNGIENHIEKLKQQKEQLSKDSCVSTADINRFDEVNTKEILLQNDIDKIQESIKFLSEINAIVEPINYNLPDQVSSWYHGISKTLLSRATEYWQLEKNKFLEIQKKKLSVIQSDFENNHKIKENLQNKISENEAIVKLTAQIQEEMEKYNKIVELEKIYENFSKEYHKFLEQVVSSKNFYKSKHEQYAKSINENKSLSVSDLDFSVSIPFRKEAFCDKIKQIIDNRTLKKKYNLDEWNEKKYSEEIYSLISSILSGELTLVKSYTMETALREIASDWYNTTYSVKMDQDDITVMSPGKKALVLLKLLISLANSKCPILIDQPEDDLDNRSIFDDLIPFIKSKKKDRQIIIVTHNANIVLGSDAEEVIVANQDGQNARNDIFRFEYRSGSIENDCALCEGDKIKKGILNKQGIQQHICDILEGGQKAFDLRKHKYRM